MSGERRRSGLPRRLGEDVRSELARLGGSEASVGMAELTRAWPAAVGETIAANAWPARVARDGTLIVHASSSTWAFELGQLEQEIRDRLGPTMPRRLRFVVGPVPSPGPEPATTTQRSLHRPTPEERARGREIAREIDDPGLRELVARAAAASLAAAAHRPGPTASSDRLRQE